MSQTDYAKDALVSADWVEDHLEEFGSDDPDYRLIEADIDYDESYAQGHIPGAIGFRWTDELQDPHERDLLKKEQFEEVMGSRGVTEDSTVVLYGDEWNQWAAYTYWQFKYYGHEDVYLLDGGRKYWLDNDYPTTTDEPDFPEQDYTASGPDEDIRTYRQNVEEAMEGNLPMVDVRSPEEFRGEIIAPPDSEETARRAGHIPGAQSIPWSNNVNDDGTFKTREELQEFYNDQGVTDDQSVIAYCRIGERSSITWFTLHELLGYNSVQNYDGSWTEWGNMIRAPIETGEDQ